MNETSLRELLTARAGTVADNPDRVREVHARITGIRRRRTAGAALVLVLLALAGALLTRLPGRPETLPAGVPPGPYFSDDGELQSVPEFRGTGRFTFAGDAVWSFAVSNVRLPHVVVARCDHRSDLKLRGLLGSDRRLSCRVPVAGHYEGALALDGNLTVAPTARPVDVQLEPGTAGDWTVGVLEPLFPDRLTEGDLAGATVSGYTRTDRISMVVPSTFAQTRGLFVNVQCVRGVRLEVRIDDRLAATLACTDANIQVPGAGLIGESITDPVVQLLGLRPLQRISITFRQVAGPAKQWALVGVS